MEKKQGRITLTDYYLRFHKLDNYSKILNRMTVPEVRLLIYIDAILNKNEDAFALHNSEEVHNLFIEKLVSYTDKKISKLDEITKLKAENLIPTSYFKWIINDLRTSLYVGSLLRPPISIGSFLKQDYLDFIHFILSVSQFIAVSEIATLTTRDIRIEQIDLATKPNIKNRSIEIYMFRKYYLDLKIKQKSIKWIDKNDGEQIDWLHDYLIEANKLCLSDSFIPNDYEEKYAQILASFDAMPKDHNTPNDMLPRMKDGSYRVVDSIRDYYLTSIKNAWNAHTYRRGKSIEKSDRQVILTKKNFDKLKKLAKFNNELPNKYTNKWIANEYERFFTQNSNDETILDNEISVHAEVVHSIEPEEPVAEPEEGVKSEESMRSKPNKEALQIMHTAAMSKRRKR